MPKYAQTADGIFHEFPDDTPDSVMDKAVAEYWAKSTAQVKGLNEQQDRINRKQPVKIGEKSSILEGLVGGTVAAGDILGGAVGMPLGLVKGITRGVATGDWKSGMQEFQNTMKLLQPSNYAPDPGFLQNLAGYKAPMKPFEVLSEAIKGQADIIQGKTGGATGIPSESTDLALNAMLLGLGGRNRKTKAEAKEARVQEIAKNDTTIADMSATGELARRKEAAVKQAEAPRQPARDPVQMEFNFPIDESFVARDVDAQRRAQAKAEAEGMINDAIRAQLDDANRRNQPDMFDPAAPYDAMLGRPEPSARNAPETLGMPDAAKAPEVPAFAQPEGTKPPAMETPPLEFPGDPVQGTLDLAPPVELPRPEAFSPEMPIDTTPQITAEGFRSSVPQAEGGIQTALPGVVPPRDGPAPWVPKNQRGSVGWKNDPEFIKFRNNLPKPMQGRAKELWDRKQRVEANDWVPVKPDPSVPSKNMSKVPGLEDKLDSYIVTPKSFEEVRTDLLASNDISGNWISKAGQKLASGGDMYIFIQNNPVLNHINSHIFQAIKDYEANQRQYLAKTSSREFPNTVISTFDKLTAKEQSKVLKTMLEFDNVEKAFDDIVAEKNLTKKEETALKAVRDAHDALLAKYNEARRAQGRPEVKGLFNYYPHIWNGNYRVLVKDKAGDVISVISEASKKDAQKAIDYLTAKDPELVFGEIEHRPMSEMGQQGAKSMLGVHELLSIMADGDPRAEAVSSAFRDYLAEKSRTIYGQFHHEKARSKDPVGGYVGAKDWLSEDVNRKQMLEAMVYHLESGFKWAALEKAKTDLLKVFEDPEIMKSHPNAIKFGKEYMDAVYGRKTDIGKAVDKIVDSVASLAGSDVNQVNKVLGNTSHLAQGMLLGTVNLPFLISQYTQFLVNMPRAVDIFQKAGKWEMGAIVDSLKTTTDFWTNREKMTGFAKEAADYAEKYGIGDSHYIEDIRTSSYAGKGQQIIDKAMFGPLQAAERQVRTPSFFMFAHMFKELGLDSKAALDAAYRATQLTLVNYRAHEKAGAFRDLGILGSMASRLQSFKMNQYSQLAGYIKHDQYMALTAAVSLQLGLGGLVGLYAMDEVDKLMKLFGAKQGLKEMILRNDDLGTALRFGGMSALTGADMSSKFSAANAAPDDLMGGIYPYWGYLTDVGARIKDVVVDPTNEVEWKKLAATGAPKGLQAFTDKLLTDDTNILRNPRNMEGKVRRKEDEYSTARQFAFGRSVKESKEVQLNTIDIKKDLEFQSKRSESLTKIKQAIFSQDYEQAKKWAEKYVKEYEGDMGGLQEQIGTHIGNLGFTQWEIRALQVASDKNAVKQKRIFEGRK